MAIQYFVKNIQKCVILGRQAKGGIGKLMVRIFLFLVLPRYLWVKTEYIGILNIANQSGFYPQILLRRPFFVSFVFRVAESIPSRPCLS